MMEEQIFAIQVCAGSIPYTSDLAEVNSALGELLDLVAQARLTIHRARGGSVLDGLPRYVAPRPPARSPTLEELA